MPTWVSKFLGTANSSFYFLCFMMRVSIVYNQSCPATAFEERKLYFLVIMVTNGKESCPRMAHIQILIHTSLKYIGFWGGWYWEDAELGLMLLYVKEFGSCWDGINAFYMWKKCVSLGPKGQTVEQWVMSHPRHPFIILETYEHYFMCQRRLSKHN